jgi:hypothetical protein
MVNVKSEVAKADVPNLNGRIYPASVLKKMVKAAQPLIRKKKMVGYFGMVMHPSLDDITHQVTKLKFVKGRVVAEVKILDTPKGKKMRRLLELNKDALVLRTAGIATIKKNIVQDDYKLAFLNLVKKEKAS